MMSGCGITKSGRLYIRFCCPIAPHFSDREKDLQKQVTLVKGQLREVRTANESTQAKLLDHSQRQGLIRYALSFVPLLNHTLPDHEVVAKLAELDMVVADLESANTRVATLERRNVGQRCFSLRSRADDYVQELLRADIEALRSGSATSDRSVLPSLYDDHF
jgi:homeobox protein cut-like